MIVGKTYHHLAKIVLSGSEQVFAGYLSKTIQNIKSNKPLFEKKRNLILLLIQKTSDDAKRLILNLRISKQNVNYEPFRMK